MKILIIGGEGYIGTYLNKHLVSQGLDVQTFGNRKQDYNILKKEYLSKFTHIVLLAGHSSVQCCAGVLESPWKNNVRNFNNLVHKTDNKLTIIYASSASVYGNKDVKRLYTEDEISIDYVNNYDLTKVNLDLLALKYIHEGRKIIGLRFGTVNGGSPVIRRDLMINSMVYSAITKGHIFITNKHIKRPILSVRDLSRAVESIIIQNTHSNIFNLATFNSTVEDICKIVNQYTKIEIIDKGNTSGTYNFAIDNTKFKALNNFVYKDTIHSVIESVIECYTNKNPKVVIRNEYFQYD